MTSQISDKITYKQVRSHFLIAGLLGLTVGCLIVYAQYKLFFDKSYHQTKTLLSITATASSITMEHDHENNQLSKALVNKLISHPTIIYAAIIDQTGERVAHAERSTQLSPYRWLSSSFFGNNIPLKQDILSVNKKNNIGYLLVELDTHAVGQTFLKNAMTAMISILGIAWILAGFLNWLNNHHFFKPIARINQTLSDIDSKKFKNLKLSHNHANNQDEIAFLIENINKLLDITASNLARRERAEDDLRKNLASLDHIVAERTEALRKTNKKLQSLVADIELKTEQAEALAQHRSDFLHILSHEVTINLNNLINILTASNQTHTQSTHQHYLSAHATGKNIIHMIKDMLDLADVKNNTLIIKYYQFNLGELIEQITSLHHQDAQKRNINLYSKLDPHLPEIFMGDGHRIWQIVNTVLYNLLKFSDNGDIELNLTQTYNQGIIINLKDNGISITENSFKALFEPASQIENQPGYQNISYWGLSYCNRLLNLMGGKVELVTQESTWVEFRIHLPIKSFGSCASIQWCPLLSELKILLACSENTAEFNILTSYLKAWNIHYTTLFHSSSTNTTPDYIKISQQYDLCITDSYHTIYETVLALEAETSNFKFLFIPHTNEYCKPWQKEAFRIFDQIPYPVNQKTLLLSLLLFQEHLIHSINKKEIIKNKPQALQSIRILLVESNPIHQAVTTMLLDQFNCQVTSAKNGVEALELITDDAFDILFMDAHMPIMDGFETVKLIHENLSSQKPPIVAITSDESDENIKQCLHHGMHDVLIRPFSSSDLSTLLVKWLPKHPL